MTELGEVTVRDLLPDQFKDLGKEVKKNAQRDPDLKAAHFPLYLSDAIADKVTEEVRASLDQSVFDILAASWRKAEELRAYGIGEAKCRSDVDTTLFLAEHDLETEMHPVASLKFEGVTTMTMTFTLTLSAHVRAVQLTLRGGHITRVGGCDGAIAAQLSYRGVNLHKALKSRTLPLLPSLKLGAPGVPIGGD